MTLEVWLAFVITATLILVIPGPTIIYVVGQSLAHGRKASIPLTLGVILGDALCITLSLLGLSALLSIFSTAFSIVKYLGASYLVYLGIKMVASHSLRNSQAIETSKYNSKVLFRDVFLVNALNPKGIIFYSAFMPQFVCTQNNILFQFLGLSVTFLCLALVNVISYSLLASKTSELFNSEKFIKAFNLTGGVSLICAGLCSVTIEKK
jgi:homoserine/homoserine lactone efflux protein